jgi:membrane-associated phospholipid phosphatase
MRLLIVFCLLLSSFGNQVHGQYTLNTARESILLGTGGVLSSAGLLYLKEFPPLSEEDIHAYYRTPPEFAFKPDRWAIKQSSKTAKTISDICLTTSIIPPLLLAFDRPKADDGRSTHSVMMIESFILTWGATSTTKRIARRARPFMYNEDLYHFPMALRRAENGRQSFFSGHTSVTSAMYFFTAATFSEYYPDSDWKPWVWGASVSVPALTGFLRVKAGKHFPTDVIVGYAVGALIGGVLVPALH